MVRFILPVIYAMLYSLMVTPGAGSVRGKALQWLAKSMGSGKLTVEQFGDLTLIMFVYSALLGNFADLFLGDRGFGPNRNGLIALLGACLGLVIFTQFGGNLVTVSHMEALVIGLVAVSTTVLVGACVLKKTFQDEASAIMSGDSSRFKSSAKPAQRTATSQRMNQVMKRRA